MGQENPSENKKTRFTFLRCGTGHRAEPRRIYTPRLHPVTIWQGFLRVGEIRFHRIQKTSDCMFAGFDCGFSMTGTQRFAGLGADRGDF